MGLADNQILGQTYDIAEVDLLEYIETRANAMQENGQWEQLQKRWVAQAKAKLLRPTPVENISPTIAPKSWRYDPTVTLPVDLYGSNGVRFAKRGDSINPLVINPLHSILIFFNGDDERQVEWAKNIINSKKQNIKAILVKGSIYELNHVLERPIYFDQAGRVTTKLNIEHVPAIVEQEESHLKVSEVLA